MTSSVEEPTLDSLKGCPTSSAPMETLNQLSLSRVSCIWSGRWNRIPIWLESDEYDTSPDQIKETRLRNN